MPMPTFPLTQLAAFRTELHACLTRRAEALFELGDALLCAPSVPSVAQLSLEPTHRRGWGSAYAALASGRIETERLRDLLASSLPDADPLVFAVDVTTWPRCDAECSPARGYYYHPSRHSAGQPIIAGWAWQWIAQLGFDRDSWTAPVDAARLHPLDDTDQQAAVQVRALLGRLGAGGPIPLVVFDAGYDSAQLTLDLAQARVAVLVRLRADRCFYADPPPPPPGKTGRPRRHGAKFNCADPTTWPVPTATLVCHDDQYGTVTVHAWAGLHPKQQRHPATAAAGRGRSCAAPSSVCRWSGSPPRRVRPRCCGCGGPAQRACSWIWTWPGGPTPAGSTWNTPSGSVSRPLADDSASAPSRPGRPVDLAGADRLRPAAPGPRHRRRSAAAVGAAPTAIAAVTGPGAPRVSAPAGHTRLAGHCAKTLRALPRPAQGPLFGTRHPLSGDQEAHQEAPQQAGQDREGRLTGHSQHHQPPPWSAANSARPPG
jgi:DDE superfamily endonuclease